MSHEVITIDRIVKFNMADQAVIKMLETEIHHGHEIVLDDQSMKLYWNGDFEVSKASAKINLNDLWELLESLGHNRNSEFLRDLYRKKGYSLFGYWEIFYWEVNNPIAHEYKPPTNFK